MPSLSQFLTVLAFKIFTCEEVEVAIMKIGLEGKKDLKNVIKEPIVCGIASLRKDHTKTLASNSCIRDTFTF
ncbi:unnamed protein product, partial [Vitis vinifera]